MNPIEHMVQQMNLQPAPAEKGRMNPIEHMVAQMILHPTPAEKARYVVRASTIEGKLLGYIRSHSRPKFGIKPDVLVKEFALAAREVTRILQWLRTRGLIYDINTSTSNEGQWVSQ